MSTEYVVRYKLSNDKGENPTWYVFGSYRDKTRALTTMADSRKSYTGMYDFRLFKACYRPVLEEETA